MQPGEVVLAVAYPGTDVTAVLSTRDGGWTPLSLDGAATLSGAVFLDGDRAVVVGQAAWHAGVAAPERFETSPARFLSQDQVALGGVEVAPVDLVAATLRRTAEAAQARLGGTPVDAVGLVVPAAWGPQRRTGMREAALRAGLGAVEVVDAPVAIAQAALAEGQRLLVGGFAVVCDLAAGEVCVLRRVATGFDLLSVIEIPDGGSAGLDAGLAAYLATLAGVRPDGPGWVGTLAAARTARQALAGSPTVAVALPERPPLVIDQAILARVCAPLLQQTTEAITKALAAAELNAGQIGLVLLAGDLAADPAFGKAVAAAGLDAAPLADPVFAAAKGAARTTGPPVGTSSDPAVEGPPLRRLAGLLLGGFASLVLLGQFLFTLQTPTSLQGGFDPTGYLQANWGELAVAAVLALLACLSAATVIASAIPRVDPFTSAHPQPGVEWASQQIGAALLAAVAFGASVACLFAIIGSVVAGVSTGPFLRWALLTQVPVAVVAALAAAVATRLGRVPAQGWHGWLRYPVASMLLAAAGVLVLHVSISRTVTPGGTGLNDTLGRVGAAMLGVAAAWVLAERRLYRIVLAVLLAVFCAAIATWSTTGLLAGVYVAAATGWWLRRLWQLLNRPRAALIPSR